MMNIIYVLWMYVLLFGVIGWMRGWAKELLVSFSVILALALNFIIRKYIPLASTLQDNDPTLFWMRTIIMVVLVYFGYQTVITVQHLAARTRSERLQDILFGAILGGLNGYFIAGSLLYYMYIGNYPLPDIIAPPTDPTLVERVNQMMLYMPPQLLGEPGIYFAVILAFVFVMVVFI